MSAKMALTEIIELEEERNRAYYVDNDFFKNKYCEAFNLKYFCIKEREVTDWETYSEEKAINEETKESQKIIYLNNFKF